MAAAANAPYFAACGMATSQGRRPTMEDAHFSRLSSEPIADITKAHRSPSVLVSIFDGHRGSRSAELAAASIEFTLLTQLPNCGSSPEALYKAYDAIELSLRQSFTPESDDGCAAITLLIQGTDLYVANAGDCRAVLCRCGRPISLSVDHKPDRSSETARILASGCTVAKSQIPIGNVSLQIGPARVWPAGLALSRTLGDICFKQNNKVLCQGDGTASGISAGAVVAAPEVRGLTIGPGDSCVIVACDGLWDCLTPGDVATCVEAALPHLISKVKRSSSLIRRGLRALVTLASLGILSQDSVLDHRMRVATRRETRSMVTTPMLSMSAGSSTDSQLDPIGLMLEGLEPQELENVAQALAAALVRRALRAGSTDNVSVAVVLFNWRTQDGRHCVSDPLEEVRLPSDSTLGPNLDEAVHTGAAKTPATPKGSAVTASRLPFFGVAAPALNTGHDTECFPPSSFSIITTPLPSGQRSREVHI